MKITTDDVLYVANLARLKVNDDEALALQKDMAGIIDFMDMLNEVDTSSVQPTNHVLAVENVFREDELTGSYPREDILRNAPQQQAGCYLVPKVVE